MDFNNLFEIPALFFYFSAKFLVGFLIFVESFFIGQIAYHIALSIFNISQFSRTSTIQAFFWILWGCLLELVFFFFLKFTVTTTKAFSPFFSFFPPFECKWIHLSRKLLFHILQFGACAGAQCSFSLQKSLLYFFSIQGLIQPSVLFRLWKSSK